MASIRKSAVKITLRFSLQYPWVFPGCELNSADSTSNNWYIWCLWEILALLMDVCRNLKQPNRFTWDFFRSGECCWPAIKDILSCSELKLKSVSYWSAVQWWLFRQNRFLSFKKAGEVLFGRKAGKQPKNARLDGVSSRFAESARSAGMYLALSLL